MLVYDITNGESFDKVEKWLRKIEEVKGLKILIINNLLI